MAGITLEIAEKHLQTWLEAEEAVSTGQGYTIGSRTLTRANLTEIGNRIKYWDNIVKNLESVAKNKGRNKVRRVVPRDL
jgi:type I restriction-modification system DNA methylase subunit